MKKTLGIAAAVLTVLACSKPQEITPGPDGPDEKTDTSIDLTQYTVVYSADAEDEEGITLAQAVLGAVRAKTGKTLPVTTDKSGEKAKEILIGRTNRKASTAYYNTKPAIFDYYLGVKDGKIILGGGSCWGMEKVAGMLKQTALSEGLEKKGSVYGEMLFPREEGTNLRILDDNIWQYDNAANAPAWAAVGADCTNAVRCIGFAGLFLGYLPDIITLQEYSKKMDSNLRPRLEARGYKLAFTPGATWNYTPVFYNSAKVKLINTEYHKYEPATWSNSGTKSYNSAVFSLLDGGAVFAVLNTHLWWKSESAQAGSNAARESQVREMIAHANSIKSTYNCPVFVMGDMNCNLTSTAMKQFLDADYKPLWDIATVFGDKRNGHHTCSADGFSRASNKADNGYGCIDQFFLWNGGATEVKTFRRIETYFTVELTDHYPNYADIVIK